MEIVTKRFLLRDFIDSDRAPFLEYQADPRNLTFYNPEESSPDRAAHLFELFQAWAQENPRCNYQLAIIRRQAPHNLLGCCGLREVVGKSEEMELGIELAPNYWGRYGYAIEVGRSLLDYGFRELNLAKISGSTISANVRVERLAAWFGAEIVEIDPGAAWMSARGWSDVTWRISKQRWEDRAAG
ncbi:GNAT family N-acetyltransferase [Chamaesiphon polymorphus]|uniref:N-acetyltransferase n=1 Tax=Chamaesiphon polymorphus CCALA 037 TaxID=2107692 RepID=A0A2T1GIG1_9CYAN|nr:GNAT family N-acetyltransferase [Chamaesiphon polymorphus]PSB57509.1 N-acetyltransferase [Chamaesiphon polymorphus CCALA 037]